MTRQSANWWSCPCGAYNSVGYLKCPACGHARTSRQTRTDGPSTQNAAGGRVKVAARPPEAVRALNKSETRALERAKRQYPGATIIAQGLTLPLTDGQTYRVDLLILEPVLHVAAPEPCWARLVEVKGGYRGPGWEHGLERYRRARAEYPELRFELWQMDKEG